jgi:hypothetical protein
MWTLFGRTLTVRPCACRVVQIWSTAAGRLGCTARRQRRTRQSVIAYVAVAVDVHGRSHSVRHSTAECSPSVEVDRFDAPSIFGAVAFGQARVVHLGP